MRRTAQIIVRLLRVFVNSSALLKAQVNGRLIYTYESLEVCEITGYSEESAWVVPRGGGQVLLQRVHTPCKSVKGTYQIGFFI